MDAVPRAGIEPATHGSSAENESDRTTLPSSGSIVPTQRRPRRTNPKLAVSNPERQSHSLLRESV